MAMSERAGGLTVRLAASAEDLARVQRLRWRVFVEEMGASGDAGGSGLETDTYDAYCDHLMVVATDPATGAEQVVGTYRLLREHIAQRRDGFYTAREFDLGPLVKGRRGTGQLLELGRSCVLPEYRTSHTISLLWRGISLYAAQHGVSSLFGCASFPGTDPAVHAAGLSYLAHRFLAPNRLRPTVRAGLGVPLEQLVRGSYDERRALMSLPPLVKGYLRTGAMFGDGAYVDHVFGTIDVCVVLPLAQLTERYAARFHVAA